MVWLDLFLQTEGFLALEGVYHTGAGGEVGGWFISFLVWQHYEVTD